MGIWKFDPYEIKINVEGELVEAKESGMQAPQVAEPRR
jgi:hypothetical protein